MYVYIYFFYFIFCERACQPTGFRYIAASELLEVDAVRSSSFLSQLQLWWSLLCGTCRQPSSWGWRLACIASGRAWTDGAHAIPQGRRSMLIPLVWSCARGKVGKSVRSDARIVEYPSVVKLNNTTPVLQEEEIRCGGGSGKRTYVGAQDS